MLKIIRGINGNQFMIMTKTFQIVLITLILSFSGISHAFDGKGKFGIGINAGGFFPTVSDDSSPYTINNNLIVGANFDVRLNREWGFNISLERIENGFFYRSEKAGTITSYPILVNIRRNLYKWGPFIPYMKMGGGFVFNGIDITIDNASAELKDSAAYQGCAGMDIYLTEKTVFNIDMGYIYYNPELKIDAAGLNEDDHFDMSGIKTSFGLKYFFR